MNDERINKILEWLGDRITKAENFVIDQAPDVVQQIITMDIVSSAIHASMLIVAALFVLVAIAVLWWLAGRFPDPADTWGTRLLGCGFLCFLATLAIYYAVSDATLIVKATYAPKAYLLQRVGVLK